MTYKATLLISALTAFSFSALANTNNAQPQAYLDVDSLSTHTLVCNLCNEKQKLDKVSKIANGSFFEGDFRFVVINLLGGNMREYRVSVPFRTTQDIAENLQPAIVTPIQRDNQAALDEQIKALLDVSLEIDDIPAKALGAQPLSKKLNLYSAILNTQMSANKVGSDLYQLNHNRKIQNLLTLDKTSPFKHIGQALEYLNDFESFVNYNLTKAYKVQITERDNNPVLTLKANRPQDGFNDIVINPQATSQVTFSDGSTLQFYIELAHLLGSGLEPQAKLLKQGTDSKGTPIPLSAFDVKS